MREIVPARRHLPRGPPAPLPCLLTAAQMFRLSSLARLARTATPSATKPLLVCMRRAVLASSATAAAPHHPLWKDIILFTECAAPCVAVIGVRQLRTCATDDVRIEWSTHSRLAALAHVSAARCHSRDGDQARARIHCRRAGGRGVQEDQAVRLQGAPSTWHRSMHPPQGKWLVFFFYPLDFTFVCPTEIIAFSDRAAEFNKLGLACMAREHV